MPDSAGGDAYPRRYLRLIDPIDQVPWASPMCVQTIRFSKRSICSEQQANIVAEQKRFRIDHMTQTVEKTVEFQITDSGQMAANGILLS
jgi:hypothetical protein